MSATLNVDDSRRVRGSTGFRRSVVAPSGSGGRQTGEVTLAKPRLGVAFGGWQRAQTWSFPFHRS